jgi:hypothetical protein
MLKIITALNGRDERTRSSVIMMSSFEINLVCDLFVLTPTFLARELRIRCLLTISSSYLTAFPGRQFVQDHLEVDHP